MLVHWEAGGLDHENIRPAHVLQYLDVALTVRKARDRGLAPLQPEEGANLIRQRLIGGAAEDFELFVMTRLWRLVLGLRRRLLVLAFRIVNCCCCHCYLPFELVCYNRGLPVIPEISHSKNWLGR